MPGNKASTVFIGNLDERVSDRVLYDVLIQAGRVVDLHVPRDRETNRLKGYAFAEYETEEIADYAVRLFTGLVTLYNRTLRFSISGLEKPSNTITTSTLTSPMPRSHQHVQFSHMENQTSYLTSSYRSSAYTASLPIYDESEPPPPGVEPSNGHRSDYGRLSC